METKPSIPQLDELAQTQPGALEAALEDMVNSGFGEIRPPQPPQPAPTPGPKVQAYWGWW